ncbi:MAG: type III-B CRISPR module RAMP protein Cmr6, partial [Clostridia bacterium]|nr:type III-B CRISPR module RAMP protein Cmr6 [Clostridia bacterium]
MKNLNLIFNKTYYDGIPDNESFNINLKQRESFNRELEQRNRDLMNTTFEKSDYTECAVDGAVSFLMKTSYPGLLVGTGYAHGAGLDDVNEDINCGFSFDYVTGQPYIPGSSVKGILRNAFRKEVLSEAIAGACGIEKEDVKKLENSIFGTSAEEDTEDEDGVDVFLDAVIRHGDAEKRILSDDYITPHPSPVENPTPIHIIKILPEVAVEFRFVLKDSVIDGVTVDIKTKLELFKGIIGFLGVGAKTNVGYGAMRPYEGETEEYWKNA